MYSTTKKTNRHYLNHTYSMMKGRCYNPNNKSYKDYGGRGIYVCDRWRSSFKAFVEDMGDRPNGYTLERIDNKKGYAPDNCKWATRTEQNLNTRRNKHPYVYYVATRKHYVVQIRDRYVGVRRSLEEAKKLRNCHL